MNQTQHTIPTINNQKEQHEQNKFINNHLQRNYLPNKKQIKVKKHLIK